MTQFCPDCLGSGADEEKTKAMYKRESSSTGYIQCHNCNGNGLDPAAYFRLSNLKEHNDLTTLP